MNSRPQTWTRLLTALGFRRNKTRNKLKSNGSRKLRYEQCEHRRMLATFTVNTIIDPSTFILTDSEVSLREAIFRANEFTNLDTITFDPAFFNTPKTILLTQGELFITESVTIDGTVDGAGPSNISLGITIDAQHNSRIFGVAGGISSQVEINALTLTKGSANFPSGGGAIFATSSLVVRNSTITGNTSNFGDGGGILATRALTIENSTISGNSTAANGGGIAFGNNEHQDALSVVASKISGNQAAIVGGGVYVHGDYVSASIQSTQVTGNASHRAGNRFDHRGGGGIAFYAQSLNLSSSTISNNYTDGGSASGGGIWASFSSFSNSRSIDISSCVFQDNYCKGGSCDGGGLYLNVSDSSMTITNTTISNNRALGNEANVGGAVILANDNSNIVVDRINIVGNHADDDIGGMLVDNSGSVVTIRNSTVSGNTASHTGGPYDAASGVWLEAKAGGSNTIEDSTISGNRIITGPDGIKQNVPGAGVFIYNRVGTTHTLQNTTISGNKAEGDGGGVRVFEPNGGPIFIRHSTITNNRADSDNDGIGTGGGISIGNSATSLTLDHTIVAGNLRGTGAVRDDISGAVTAAWSLIGDSTGATITDDGGNQIGIGAAPIDPRLGPLVYNGGPTFLDGSKMLTHALLAAHAGLPDSPAINRGDTNFNAKGLDGLAGTADDLRDQRGAPWYRLAGLRIDIGAFEMQHNPVLGDYNFNGNVDIADYTVWRDTLGSTTDLRADFDGNGVVDVMDYQNWKTNFGHVMGDASGNGAADFADYLIWNSTYGSTSDLRADANEDGIVDDADFDIWFDTFGSTLANGEFGLLSSYFDPDAPPTVVGLALGYSGVEATDFADKVGSGEQIRSVPLIAANRLNITFSRDVDVDYNDLQLFNLDGSAPSIFDFDYDPLSQTATWTFTSSLSDGRYLIRLSDAIEDSSGKALDGEFFNPISVSDSAAAVFPSGDGEEGGEFRFRFTVLYDDSDHDNVHGAANYSNWQSTEPGMIIVSTTADDFDSDLSFGDVSLREAVHYANIATGPMTIQLPAGRYGLTLTGTEAAGTAQNDLDVSGNVSILGAGAGLSVIAPAWTSAPTESRMFEVSGAAARLRLQGVSVTGASIYTSPLGAAAFVHDQAELEVIDSAIVRNIGYGTGVAIRSQGSDVTIRRSVFTNNQGLDGVAVWSSVQGANAGSLTIGESIFARNTNWGSYYYPANTPNVKADSGVSLTNLGNNLYDNATGGFFNVASGTGDHLGAPQYVVTSVADTFHHADDIESLSLREAVDLANQATGQQEIWVPAWRLTLTRDRGTNATDTDVSYGDLDVKNSLVVRGVTDRTSIAWKPDVFDDVFDLLGDFNDDGDGDYGAVSAADYTIWQDQAGSAGEWGQFSADADDDGDVDTDDFDIWSDNFGHTLQLVELVG